MRGKRQFDVNAWTFVCVCYVFMGMLAWGGRIFTEFCLYEIEQNGTEATF